MVSIQDEQHVVRERTERSNVDPRRVRVEVQDVQPLRVATTPDRDELIEPVIISIRKEAWPIPPEEQEWIAYQLSWPGGIGSLLRPVGCAATEQGAIVELARQIEEDRRYDRSPRDYGRQNDAV